MTRADSPGNQSELPASDQAELTASDQGELPASDQGGLTAGDQGGLTAGDHSQFSLKKVIAKIKNTSQKREGIQ